MSGGREREGGGAEPPGQVAVAPTMRGQAPRRSRLVLRIRHLLRFLGQVRLGQPSFSEDRHRLRLVLREPAGQGMSVALVLNPQHEFLTLPGNWGREREG